jgi:hypothetical protein
MLKEVKTLHFFVITISFGLLISCTSSFSKNATSNQDDKEISSSQTNGTSTKVTEQTNNNTIKLPDTMNFIQDNKEFLSGNDCKDSKNKNNCASFNKEDCQLSFDEDEVKVKCPQQQTQGLSLLMKGFDPLLMESKTLEDKSIRFYVETPKSWEISKSGNTILELSSPLSSLIDENKKVCIEKDTCSFCIIPTLESVIKSQPEWKNRKLGKLEEKCQSPQEEKHQLPQVTAEELSPYRLIVISLSQGLDANSVGTAIQTAFIEFLKEERSNLDIYTIQSGRLLKQVKIPEELNKLKSILMFSADDLRAMDDLTLLDSIVRDRDSDSSKRVGKILYITDNSFLTTNEPKNIPSAPLGVIKVWNDLYKINVHILTIGNCTVWTKGAETSCKSDIKTSSQFIDYFKNFIQ